MRTACKMAERARVDLVKKSGVFLPAGVSRKFELSSAVGATFVCGRFRDSNAACVRMKHPLTAEFNYFEVKLIKGSSQASSEGAVRVGVGLGHYGYSGESMPGWSMDSIGYHSDDGKLFHEEGKPERTVYGPVCSVGDVMGCGADFEEGSLERARVWFTKNGELAGYPVVNVAVPNGGFFALIGFAEMFKGECVGTEARYLGHSELSLQEYQAIYPCDGLTIEEEGTEAGQKVYTFQEDWLRGGNWVKGCGVEGKSGYFYKSFLQLTSEIEKQPNPDSKIMRGDPPGSTATFLGKEFTFLQKPDEWLECTICQQLSDKPHQIPCCGGQTICEKCAEECKKRSDNCPLCRRSPFETVPDVRGERFVNNLQTYCPNYARGCDWKSDLKSVKEHVTAVCDYTVKPCPLGCGVKLMAMHHDAHVENECKFRVMDCPRCELGKRLTYDSIVRSHFKKCTLWPVLCPNRCEASMQSERPIFRSSLEGHLETCLEQKVCCALGCGEQVRRKLMPHHIDTEKDKHIHCLQERLLKAEEENQKLRKTIEELKESSRQLKEFYTYNVFD